MSASVPGFRQVQKCDGIRDPQVRAVTWHRKEGATSGPNEIVRSLQWEVQTAPGAKEAALPAERRRAT